jgi:hypothetical protein
MSQFKSIEEIYAWANNERDEVLNKIENQFYNYILEFQDKCKHIYPDGNSAVKKICDDDDCEGYHIPTFESWDECIICRKKWNIEKSY